jgi:NADPH-dependent 2,4-dienoyl-CoA reductase/sulfur reductase-like enzyme/rhodanese-related sulfurtransferase
MALNVVVIGAVALGPKAACRIKRLVPDARVTMVEQGEHISYGGCGIPYYVSGDVGDIKELKTTSFHMVRNPGFFHDSKGVEVLIRKRAERIDRQAKVVHVRDVDSGETSELAYDKLVLGMGSRPRRPDLPGMELGGVFTVSNLEEAEKIRQRIQGGKVEKAVVIGAGFIGLEMAEALRDLWDIQTTVVEIADQILPGFVSPDLAGMAQKHMEEHEVAFLLSQKVLGFEGTEGQVGTVRLESGVLEADLVIMSVGVIPNSELAAEAGLDVSPKGTIIVNDRMQTSDPDIYAGGNCVQVPNQITGQPAFYPLGSLANRQGRVIGTNIVGGQATFTGAVGSFVVKLFEYSVAGTGFSLEMAKRNGLEAICAHVSQFDRAHFFPSKELMHLELVVETSGRVLGIQGLGRNGDAMVGRISAVAPLLPHHPQVEEISNLELPYSPPFSSAMDIINAVGNAAENILAGRNHVMSLNEFQEVWNSGKGDFVVLDCRDDEDPQVYMEKHPGVWMNIPHNELRQRMDEVPRDKKIFLICGTGVRSYESQILLDAAGIHGSLNLQGGVASLRKSSLDV